MELKFAKLEFHVAFFFLIPRQIYFGIFGLELEFQNQSNKLISLTRILTNFFKKK